MSYVKKPDFKKVFEKLYLYVSRDSTIPDSLGNANFPQHAQCPCKHQAFFCAVIIEGSTKLLRELSPALEDIRECSMPMYFCPVCLTLYRKQECVNANE